MRCSDFPHDIFCIFFFKNHCRRGGRRGRRRQSKLGNLGNEFDDKDSPELSEPEDKDELDEQSSQRGGRRKGKCKAAVLLPRQTHGRHVVDQIQFEYVEDIFYCCFVLLY